MKSKITTTGNTLVLCSPTAAENIDMTVSPDISNGTNVSPLDNSGQTEQVVTFPEHVIALADIFHNAEDYDGACKILDGYAQYGEPYIEGLYSFIAVTRGLTYTAMNYMQPTLFDESISHTAA